MLFLNSRPALRYDQPFAREASHGAPWRAALVAFGLIGCGHLTMAAAGPSQDDKIPELPDFGYCGAPSDWLYPKDATITLHPTGGDDLAQIQAAIRKVSLLPVGHDGFRGVIALEGDRFHVSGSIRIEAGGVVLRGTGDAAPLLSFDTGTNGDAVIIVMPTGPVRTNSPVSQEDAAIRTIERSVNAAQAHVQLDVSAAYAGSDEPTAAVVDSVVPAGALEFRIAPTLQLRPGDRIVFIEPSTGAWIRQVNNGETMGWHPWRAGMIDIRYFRTVKAVSDDKVTIDAPIYEEDNRAIAPAYVKMDRQPTVDHVGIEHLRLDVCAGERSDASLHRRVGIRFSQVRESRIDDVTIEHYDTAGIELTKGCLRLSIARCRVANPKGPNDSGHAYAYKVKAGQLLLFDDCVAQGARYSFAFCGGPQDSGIVVHRCVSDGAREFGVASVGAWAHAILIDQFSSVNDVPGEIVGIDFGNRGSAKEGPGWTMSRAVAWNCNLGTSVISAQKPPIGQNFVLHCTGKVQLTGPVDAPAAFVAASAVAKDAPASLYEYQVRSHLAGTRKP